MAEVEPMTAAEWIEVGTTSPDADSVGAALREREQVIEERDRLAEIIEQYQGLRVSDDYAIAKEPGKGWYVPKRQWCGREPLPAVWRDNTPIVYYPTALDAIRAVWEMKGEIERLDRRDPELVSYSALDWGEWVDDWKTGSSVLCCKVIFDQSISRPPTVRGFVFYPGSGLLVKLPHEWLSDPRFRRLAPGELIRLVVGKEKDDGH